MAQTLPKNGIESAWNGHFFYSYPPVMSLSFTSDIHLPPLSVLSLDSNKWARHVKCIWSLSYFLGRLVHFDGSEVYTWLLPLLLQFDRRGRSVVQLSASSPSVPPLSFSSPPSLPPARPPPSSMSSWRLTPVAARCRAPQVIQAHNLPIFSPFRLRDPKILIYVLFWWQTPMCQFVPDCFRNLIWPMVSSIFLSDPCVPFFPHHTSCLYIGILHIFTNGYYLAKNTWLRFCTDINTFFLEASSLQNPPKWKYIYKSLKPCYKFLKYPIIWPFGVGTLHIHLERGIKLLLLFADQRIRFRICRLYHFQIWIDHFFGISWKYLFPGMKCRAALLTASILKLSF